MKPANLEAIQHSFTMQAPNFEGKTVNFSKEEYLNYTISRVAPKGQDSVLEAAAGHLRRWYRALYVWTQPPLCYRLESRKPRKAT